MIGRVGAIAAGLLFAEAASASVSLSEIAWMGTAADANAEWIELFNGGSDVVDLAGFTLTAADGAPSITLSGTIAAGGYFLLERTDDETVSSVSADLVYTGGLSNAGEKLVLYDASGTAIDAADGSDAWALGGDNVTKETLQRAAGSWITAAPTPKKQNAASASKPAATAAAPSGTKRAGARPVITGAPKSTDSVPVTRRNAIYLDIAEEHSITAGVPYRFAASILDEDGSELSKGTVGWSFGDGVTGEGKTVAHTYQHQGTYVVVATARYQAFKRELTDTVRAVAHVRAPTLSVPNASPEYIELRNEGAEEIEVSGFTLVVQGARFRLPERSYLLPDASIRIAASVSGLHPDGPDAVEIYSPAGMLLPRAPAPAPSGTESSEARPDDPDGDFEEISMGEEEDPEALTAQPVPSDTIQSRLQPAASALAAAPIGASTASEGSAVWWYLLCLSGLVGAGVAAALMLRRERDATEALAREFTLIDEDQEKP